MKYRQKIFFIPCFWVCFFIWKSTFAQVGYINTIAGTGTMGNTGNGGVATAAQLENPSAVAVDDSGNVYISDSGNGVIRKINTNGIINNFASFSSPANLVFDKKGNLYATSSPPTNVVVKIDKQGNVSNFAGTGIAGYSGDSGQATAANLHSASALAFDKHGNLYIADALNYVIRKVDTSGVITTFAGNGVAGYSGDGGPAILASFHGISSIAIDTNDNVFLSDLDINIRKIDRFGIISTYVGRSYSYDSPDTITRDSCGVWTAQGLSIDSLGQIYYVDQTTARVKQVNKNDTVYTIAGLHVPGYNGDNIPAIQAQINHAAGTCFDRYGNLYIADVDNQRIRKITYSQSVGIKKYTDNKYLFSFYPNPASEILNIELKTQNETTVQILNILGEELVATKEKKIDVSSLPSGVYFVRMCSSTQKLVVEH